MQTRELIHFEDHYEWATITTVSTHNCVYTIVDTDSGESWMEA